MFKINQQTKQIFLTRGDIATIEVSSLNEEGGEYEFEVNDVIRFKIFLKKDCEAVVLKKDFTVLEKTTKVDVILTSKDTKIGDIIDKPVDYWYEVELNPDSNPQTIIGYEVDEETKKKLPKIFTLLPEGGEKVISNPNTETPDTENNIPNNFEEKDPTVPYHVKQISKSDIINWNNKSNFDGNWASLVGKPIIPTKTSQLTNDSGFMTEIPNEYITESKLNSKGYLTSYNETDPLFKASASFNITNEDLKKWDSKSEFSGSYSDLTDKPTIPTKISELTNDSGYITSIPTEYITESELNEKKYLTSIPSDYKTKTENDSLYQPKGTYLTSFTEKDPTVPTHVKNITQTDISNWNNKSNFSGNYNDLTNKPTIPEGLESPLKGKKITVLGDSISAGLYANTNWCTVLGEKTGAIITNLASSGATITHIEGDGNNFANIALNNQSTIINSDYLVIMGGGNDYLKNAPIGTSNDTEATTMKGSLSAILSTVQKLNPNVKIFISTNPTATRSGLGLTDFTYESYNNALEEMARLYHIPFLNLWSNFGLNPQISQVADIFYNADLMHLKDAGQIYLADKMKKFLETEVLNNSYNAVTWNGYRLSVLTQSQYSALTKKDEHTLYIIKG